MFKKILILEKKFYHYMSSSRKQNCANFAQVRLYACNNYKT